MCKLAPVVRKRYFFPQSEDSWTIGNESVLPFIFTFYGLQFEIYVSITKRSCEILFDLVNLLNFSDQRV